MRADAKRSEHVEFNACCAWQCMEIVCAVAHKNHITCFLSLCLSYTSCGCASVWTDLVECCNYLSIWSTSTRKMLTRSFMTEHKNILIYKVTMRMVAIYFVITLWCFGSHSARWSRNFQQRTQSKWLKFVIITRENWWCKCDVQVASTRHNVDDTQVNSSK